MFYLGSFQILSEMEFPAMHSCCDKKEIMVHIGYNSRFLHILTVLRYYLDWKSIRFYSTYFCDKKINTPLNLN